MMSLSSLKHRAVLFIAMAFALSMSVWMLSEASKNGMPSIRTVVTIIFICVIGGWFCGELWWWLFKKLFSINHSSPSETSSLRKNVGENLKPTFIDFRPRVYLLTLLIVMLLMLIGPILWFVKGESVQQEDWIKLIATEALIIVAGILSWYQVKRLLCRKTNNN